jgi:hypothetical protein
MKKITINGERTHLKASEKYVDVIFIYDNQTIWNGSIPIEYRRTGVELTEQEDIQEYIEKAYEYCHPNNYKSWKQEQEEFWLNKAKAKITKEIFDALITFQGNYRAISTIVKPKKLTKKRSLPSMLSN